MGIGKQNAILKTDCTRKRAKEIAKSTKQNTDSPTADLYFEKGQKYGESIQSSILIRLNF